MLQIIRTPISEQTVIEGKLNEAIHAIPPLWPLTHSVAVNPFLGQASLPFAEAAAKLAKVSGTKLTLPRAWYVDKVRSGEITDADIQTACQELGLSQGTLGSDDLTKDTSIFNPAEHVLASIAGLATDWAGTNWVELIEDRIGSWASAYFDEGQALWPMTSGKGAWSSWLSWAQHDLTPEIFGLKNFAKQVQALPESADAFILQACESLKVPSEHLSDYFHQLLLSLGGWSQLARYRLWQAELAENSDRTLRDLLAIRLVWDVALLDQHRNEISEAWSAAWDGLDPCRPLPDSLEVDLLLHTAFERSKIRQLGQTLRAPVQNQPEADPLVQAVFCIDVRSEVFRRALEQVSARVETRGFAGFFGIPLQHHGFASDTAEDRLPVLLKPAIQSKAVSAASDRDDRSARYRARAIRAWGRFRMAAVSSFAFVESSGPIYAWRLLNDGLARVRKKSPAALPVQLDPAFGTKEQVDLAKSVLTAMSLTEGFAPIVLLVGHGAKVTNNPHASALHCGACGGHAGDVNASLLAQILNQTAVRAGLADHNIHIPDETQFFGALHSTTTDEVEVFDDQPPHSLQTSIAQMKTWLAEAGKLARRERSITLPRAHDGKGIISRSHDWAEVRPEWGLANCNAFIAAPRERTRGRNLYGTAFLHEYDWKKDPEFSTLELILTAPVVVASWISLQYYGSVVAPDLFGGGNKLLHNVVGGIGVLEGNGGQLRTGLPWQSVHDGTKYIHEPARLSVCIEAPCEAISGILKKHDDVRALFDNAWLRLFVLDKTGRIAFEYAGSLNWHDVTGGQIRDRLDPVSK
jgi:uncharacterized protein YbcC (UPF0753/DUF2309 family)